MGEDEKVEDVEESKAEKQKMLKYKCIKKCYWENKIYDVGDTRLFAGDDPMLEECFKVVKMGEPVKEEIEDDEPQTLAGLAQADAQATIDSISRGGIDEDDLGKAQAPVEGPPVTVLPAEDESAENILE